MLIMHCILPFVVVVVMASTRPTAVEAFAASPSAAPAVRPSVITPAVTSSSLLSSSTKNEGNSPLEYRLDTSTTTRIFPLPTLNGNHLDLDRLFPSGEIKTEEANSSLIEDLQVQHVQLLQLHHQHPELFAAATQPPPHTSPTTRRGAVPRAVPATKKKSVTSPAATSTTTTAMTTSSTSRPSTTRLYFSNSLTATTNSRDVTDNDGKKKLDYLATITLRLFRQKIAFVLRVLPEPKRKIIIDRFVNFLIEHIL